MLAKNAAYRKAHPEKNRAKAKKYYAAHPEKVGEWAKKHPKERVASARRWQKAHPEQVKAYLFANKDKTNAVRRKWRKDNPEKAKAKDARRDPAKLKAYDEIWRKAHPEKVAAKYAKWAKANPDIVAANCGKRRAQKLKACPPWADHEAIKAKYREARRLTAETGIPHQVDHKIPLRHPLVAGLHVDWNLQVLTAAANASKGNKLLEAHVR